MLRQEILFNIRSHLLPADNPQQAESSSSGGPGSNLGCRYDKGGGTHAQKETNDGYDALFSVRSVFSCVTLLDLTHIYSLKSHAPPARQSAQLRNKFGLRV
jgi:hypothetical protein